MHEDLEGSIVPLKPIFDKAPLKALSAVGLRPGQVSAADPAVDALIALCGEDAPVELLEGLFRAGMLKARKAEQAAGAAQITRLLQTQAEDGALPGTAAQQLAAARAAFALYEATASRAVLEQLARWCGWLNAHLDEALADAAVRQHPADLMGLMLDMYRVTGKKAMLSLCERIRRGGMDWSGILHTFAVQRPMSRVTPWNDMEAGLEAEMGSEEGFYTRQYLACHGEGLADGARSALANGLYSGNGQELTAARTGWERMRRYHSAVCGGITCDEALAGTSPSAGVDAAALGAWAEALCASVEADDSLWALDEMDIMLANAMPRAVCGGRLHDLQRVNGLSLDCGDAGAYHLHQGSERFQRALGRLLRGYAAVYSHAVTVRRSGFDVNLTANGVYTVALGGTAIQVQIGGSGAKKVCTLRMKQPIRAQVRVRIPAWARESCVTVNAEGGYEGKPGEYLALERVWRDGDTLTVEEALQPRLVDAHHQGVCVMLGSTLLGMPADTASQWAVAAMGQPVMREDGSVTLPVAPLSCWRRRGDIPADVPVLPEACGDTFDAPLAPYATHCGIALFPRGAAQA